VVASAPYPGDRRAAEAADRTAQSNRFAVVLRYPGDWAPMVGSVSACRPVGPKSASEKDHGSLEVFRHRT
jgi:hypothetical protein